MQQLIDTLQTAYSLKKLKRTGWVKNNVDDPESVASHCYGCALLVLLLAKQCGVDEARCIKLALVHDLQEAIVGDITPYCGVSDQEKHQTELQAAMCFSSGFGNSELLELFKEFENNQTSEAKFVHDCDKLDMLLQAHFYEKEQRLDLQDFFNNTKLPASFQQLINIRCAVESVRK